MVLLVFVGMLGFVGCLLILVALAVSRYLTKPILNCAGAMLEIRNNHIGIQIKNTYMDEIGELIDGFNEMSGSIYSLIEKNKMISALQKDAEIKMLERQINPHFLFNTLEIINSLILSKKEKKAVKVCETLGQLYRYNLKQNKWITLKEELEYTKQYLLIMKYKINDFSYFDDVDERLMEAPFMKAILQPLVENSIKHGFQRKNQECCISIIIHLKNEKIHIEVMDNGSGMETVQPVSYTDLYERTEIRKGAYEERRLLGRNIRGLHAKQFQGELTDVRILDQGPVFVRTELIFRLEGTYHCSVILKLYRALPRLEFTLRMAKTLSEDIESVYLPLVLRLPDTRLYIHNGGVPMRPGIDQLPGTNMEYYIRCV